MRKIRILPLLMQIVCFSMLALMPMEAFADGELDDDMEEAEASRPNLPPLEESILVEVSGVLEGYIGELNSIASSVSRSKKAKLVQLKQNMTSVNVRWDAYTKIAGDDIARSEVLLEMVSQFKNLSQQVADSIDRQQEKLDAFAAFEKFEKQLPAFTRKYDKLDKQAAEYSLVSQTAKLLARVKGEEQLLAQELDEQFAKAKAAAALMPQLQERMRKMSDGYLSLKEKSESIQAAEYKTLIAKVKDYVLTLAGVAIILMFITMMRGKMKELKAARNAAKQYKEMMMKNNGDIPTICLLLSAMLLMACNTDIRNVMTQVTPVSEGVEVSEMRISDDCRTIEVHARVNGLMEMCDFSDSTLFNVKIREYKKYLIPCLPTVYPKLVSIRSIGPEQVKKRGLVMHVMVDLTQPVRILTQQREHVKTIRKLFCHNNLYVTFMLAEGKVSPTMLATDYVIDNYISPQSPARSGIYDDDGEVLPPYIYRSLSTMLDRLESDTLGNANYKLLMLFTDGNVYDEDDYPYDPNHFAVQEKLIRQARNISDNISVYYLDIAADDDGEVNENNMLKMVCQQSNGRCITSFDRVSLDNFILSSFNIDYDDYVIELRNPEEKYYFGDQRYINILFTNKADSVVASAYGQYSIASIHSPKHIGDRPLQSIATEGIVKGLAILLFCYILMQIVWPFVSYMLFRRRHVMAYTGKNMSVNNIMVPGECYLCKAPFVLGEKIVVKCKHVTHLDCWNENGHRCPEHGMHCPEGSHYYNQSNIFDPHNASFYMKWTLPVLAVAILSWSLYVLFHHTLMYNVIDAMVDISNPVSARLYHLPVFGFYISFFLALVLSVLTVHRRKWYAMVVEVICRASLSSLVTLLLFVAECAIVDVADLFDGTIIFDFLPWTLSAAAIAFISTWRSRLRPQKRHLLCSLAVGFAGTLVWGAFCDIENVTQMVWLLLAYMVFAVGIALSIAKDMPRSEHYFLHVSGPIKEMDIALYKWLRSSPNAVVTIGKSVNCTLQITWDLQSDIAPLQAEIRLVGGVPRLYVVDGDVYVGNKARPQGSRFNLYHGDKFQIGQTLFCYLET